MDDTVWMKQRKSAERLLVALGKLTSAELKTLNDVELVRIQKLLSDVKKTARLEHQARTRGGPWAGLTK